MQPVNRLQGFFQNMAKKTATVSAPAKTGFQEVFARAIKQGWKGGDAALSRRAGLKNPSNLAQARKSEPTEVTDTIRAVCRVLGLDSDALVMQHEIVRIDQPATSPMPGTIALSPAELAEAAAYLAIIDTEDGKAIRRLVRSTYEKLQSEKPHSGNP